MENIKTKMSSYEGQISRGMCLINMTDISVQFLNFETFQNSNFYMFEAILRIQVNSWIIKEDTLNLLTYSDSVMWNKTEPITSEQKEFQVLET